MQIIIPTKITNNNELLEAQAIRSKLKTELKDVEEKKEVFARPQLEAIARIREEFAPRIKFYKDNIEIVDAALRQYQNNLLREKQEIENKILSDARLAPATVIEKLAVVTQIETKGFRKHQVLKITDLSSIPKEYFDLNETRLMSDLKAGKTVKGAQIEVEMIPVE